MPRPANVGRRKPVDKSPRVPGGHSDRKADRDAAKVARAYQDLFISDSESRYKMHLQGRRTGMRPSLSDYEGSKF